MGVLGAKLMFRPPDWPVLLSVAAAVLLAWELASLLAVIWRGRGAAEAAGMTLAALLAGAVVGPIAAIYGAMSAPADGAVGTGFKPVPPGRALARACLRGSIIVAAGLATIFWPRLGSLAAIAACTIAWAVRSYSRTTSPVNRRFKAALLVLRIAVLVLLACWTARPVLERYREIRTRRKLLIGIDVSKSMQRRDVPPAGDADAGADRMGARIDAVNRTLRDQRGLLTGLLDQADVAFFTFSGLASSTAEFTDGDEVEFAAPPATGEVTALGDSAQAAFEQCLAARDEVAAVVLVTDGCNNTSDNIAPDKWAELMGSRGVPVFTVGVGSEKVTGATRTLTVRKLSAADEVNAFNRLPITAEIEAIGLDDRRVKITCVFGDKLVGQKILDVAAWPKPRTVRFVHVPLRPGCHRLVVTARCVGEAPPALAGEPKADKLVHVVDRHVRILYVEGKHRFEIKFIRQAMEGAKRFSVSRYILLQPLRRDRPGPLGEELDDWLSYHAIIFGDVSASRFSREQLEIIKELVGKYGKGFCMIGGRNSFGRGGWSDTPIADILPIDLKRSAGQTDRMLRIVPTAEGRRSNLMRIGAGDDVASAWAKLDPLPGANVLDGVKPAATVLAAAGGDMPMIVTQPYGKGRVMAIAFDTTWRWVLCPKDTAGMQKRFWRQVGMHLAAPKGNVWIATNRTSYDQRRLAVGSETVEITAGVEDSSGRPMRGARPTVKLTGPDGSVSIVKLELADALRRGKAPPLRKPGVYTLRIEARVEGKDLSAEHRFEVVRRDAEALDVLANFDLLRRMADASGGRFHPLREFARVAVKLRPVTRQKTTTEPAPEDLAEKYSWPVILAILALLCLEWAARKRKGLV